AQNPKPPSFRSLRRMLSAGGLTGRIAIRCNDTVRHPNDAIAADGDTSSEAATRQHAPEAAE
ncbi:MAG: hypothetical protein AAFR70_03745, partial [Pseudomonadota bacterium]